jgi:hypothetical protein
VNTKSTPLIFVNRQLFAKWSNTTLSVFAQYQNPVECRKLSLTAPRFFHNEKNIPE